MISWNDLKKKLGADLTNSWMNDPRYLGQIGHFLGALSIMLVAAIFGGLLAFCVCLGFFVLYAALKEYWYDARYEIPKQTWKDNTLDFGMYMAGLVVSVVVYVLARHFHRLG